jgi:hypothetical protein
MPQHLATDPLVAVEVHFLLPCLLVEISLRITWEKLILCLVFFSTSSNWSTSVFISSNDAF